MIFTMVMHGDAKDCRAQDTIAILEFCISFFHTSAKTLLPRQTCFLGLPAQLLQTKAAVSLYEK